MTRLLTWNMAHRDLWGALRDSGADLALLQEAAKPSADVARQLLPDEDGAWSTAGWLKREWRTAIARLTDDVTLSRRPTAAMHDVTSELDWTVGREGTITAADILISSEIAFTVASV